MAKGDSKRITKWSPGQKSRGAIIEAVRYPKRQFDRNQKISCAQLAAAYAYMLIKNHGFNDGNKWTGFTIAVIFVRLSNRVMAYVDNTEAASICNAVYNNKMSEQQLAEWFRDRIEGEDEET